MNTLTKNEFWFKNKEKPIPARNKYIEKAIALNDDISPFGIGLFGLLIMSVL